MQNTAKQNYLGSLAFHNTLRAAAISFCHKNATSK